MARRPEEIFTSYRRRHFDVNTGPSGQRHAYKMADTETILPQHVFQRQSSPPTGQISSDVILTKLYQDDKRQYRYDKNDNMLEVDSDFSGAESTNELSETLDIAMEHLNNANLDEAEKVFLRLHQQMQEKIEDNSQILVMTLVGLSDICMRRSRMCRSNPMECQWLAMHAIALLQHTMEVCDSELANNLDNQESEWFISQKHDAQLKCTGLEERFSRALYGWMKHDGKFQDQFRSFSLPTTPLRGIFPLSATHDPCPMYSGVSYRLAEPEGKKQSADDMSIGVDWLAKFQQYCKDRLQSNNLSEIIGRIFRPDQSKKKEDDDDRASVGSNDSLAWDEEDLGGFDEVDGVDLEEDFAQIHTPVKEHSFAFELAGSEVDEDGWDFFLEDRKDFVLQSVIQIAQKSPEKIKKEQMCVPTVFEADFSNMSENCGDKEIVSPLQEYSINMTLARAYCKLAEKLVQEEEYKSAETIYEQVLDIMEDTKDESGASSRFYAKIMKNLGTVKSKQGKIRAGLAMLNRALQWYRDLDDDQANFEIAVALLELGNGYAVGKLNEDTVFDDAIAAIAEFFEKDYLEEQTSSSSSSPSKTEVQSPDRTPEQENNIVEAITCYTEAVSLLRSKDDDKQTDIIARATMRLGDCYFMQKDYEKALACYEKSNALFQSIDIHGKEFFLENAHALSMLGVSSFMLHTYPRAASVLQLALHLVNYAQGVGNTFFYGLILAVQGITYYKMKTYHKCISSCVQSFDVFWGLFGDHIADLPKRKFWLVCQSLYVTGNSYNILGLRQKAVKYLSIARTLLKDSETREKRQFMRVLQILGDCYFGQYEYKTALVYYNEALDYADREKEMSRSQSRQLLKEDDVFIPVNYTDDLDLTNELVSKSAEAHISMNQYGDVMHYLEEAHDIQEVLGEDIKGDLVTMLQQLGTMHSSQGDVDKAMDSYKESLEVYREIHKGQLGPDMCTTLGDLATMCYVKACITDDLDLELEMIIAANKHFQEALELESNQSVCVKFSNFLYSQGNYDDAILYIEDALKMPGQLPDIVYGGLEKVTLPDLLQDEVEAQDEVIMPTSCLARYLLILSHKALGQMKMAEKQLILLLGEVIGTDIPLLYSLLGYAMMELSLFEEAAECFATAASMESGNTLAEDNYSLCLCVVTLRTLQRAFENIWFHFGFRFDAT